MDDLFNPSAFFEEGSRNKQNWMIASSGLELNAFQINGNIPLSDLIRTLNRVFRSRHRLLTELEEARGAAVPRLVADPEAPPTPIVDDGIEALEKNFEDFAAKLNHDSIIHKFYDSLSHLWPSDERAVKQEIGYNERELLCTKSKSKSKSRSRSYIGKDIGREGSSQKRLRME